MPAALPDGSSSVRLTAASSAGLWRDREALEPLLQLAIKDEMPAVRREAATALGRIGHPAAAPVLLEAIRAGGDRFLEHAQIYALIRIGDRATMAGALEEIPDAAALYGVRAP